MKILVTVKRVTDPDMKIRIKPDGSGVDVSSMSYKINPFDEIAVEEALRIKERADGAAAGEVVVVSAGPEKARTEIRHGLSMGADRGVLVQVDDYLDSDGVARILKAVVDREQPDLVLMGKQAVDVDDNQAPQLLAEYLSWGQACFASKIDVQSGKARVEREVDGGIEVIEIDLPGVISADLRLNEPRYPALPDILKAKKKPIDVLKPADLGVDITPKVVVEKVYESPHRKGGRKVADISELVRALREEAGVI